MPRVDFNAPDHKAFEGWDGPGWSPADFDRAWFRDSCFIVGVTGVTQFGHALLEVGGTFFHVTRAGFHHPSWMEFDEFGRYLRENDKVIMWREKITDLRDPGRALRELAKQMKERWLFGLIAHNCVGFVETILEAGGSTWEIHPNYPSWGPVRHAVGHLDLHASAAGLDDEYFWVREKQRRMTHPRYLAYVADTTNGSFEVLDRTARKALNAAGPAHREFVAARQ